MKSSGKDDFMVRNLQDVYKASFSKLATKWRKQQLTREEVAETSTNQG